jgi:hypothetical protein
LGFDHTRIHSSGIRAFDVPPTGPFPFSVSESTNNFSGAVGVGLNIKATEHIAVRLIQTDYLREGRRAFVCRLICPDGLRFSSGVVFGLGKK